MPHIDLPDGLPGIVSAFAFRPDTARPMRELAEVLLRGPADISRARSEGATDLEIHDTVLIAAAFCMYNRYVDGLATLTPKDDKAYHEMGARMACDGYAARRTAAQPTAAN